MTNRGVGFGRLALWFSPVVIVAGGFFVVLTWMKPSAVVAEVLTAVAGTFVLGYSLFLGNRLSRRMDEVQRAGQAFASANGWVWGGFATTVLLMVPPVMTGLVDLVNAVVEHAGHHRLSPDVANHVAVQLALFLGITLVMVMQALTIGVLSLFWWRRVGRIGEPS